MSDIQDTIKDQVTHNRVVLYMKGTPQFPQCGFSATVAEMLKRCGVTEYMSVNVLQDDGDPPGHQGILELADDSAALRQRRVRRRLRHHARDVPVGRAAAAAGQAAGLTSRVTCARAARAARPGRAAARASRARDDAGRAPGRRRTSRHVAAVGPLHRHGVDVRVGVADRRRELGQQSAPVGDQQANARSRTRPARPAPIRRRRARSPSKRCLRSVAQSRRCTISPWPLRNWPMIASPGIGRQHFAYWIATPSTPRSDNAAGLPPAFVAVGAPASSGLAGRSRQRLRDDERQPLAHADVGEDIELASSSRTPRRAPPSVPT